MSKEKQIKEHDMKRCEDCIHYELCQCVSDQYGVIKIFPSQCRFYEPSSYVAQQNAALGAKIVVPLESYDKFLESDQWALHNFALEVRACNEGNKACYKKFAKKLKKAIKFLPNNLEVVVRCKK